MIRRKSLHWLLAAAVSAALVAPASAQFQTVIDGRMREANNRVGSGGSNEGAGPIYGPQGSQIITTSQGVYGNQVVTGNVTGGGQFRGTVNYTSPTAFRGPTAGDISDNFIKQSSGAPVMGLRSSQSYNNAQGYRPFYGPSNGAPPPSGYQIQNPSIGVTQSTKSPYMREPGDFRLGAVSDTSATVLPRPGQLLMSGPVDPTSHNSTYFSASPLYGLKQLRPGQNASDRQLLDSSVGANPQLAGVKMDPALLQQMRSELQQVAKQQQLNNPIEAQTLDSKPISAFDAPVNGQIKTNALNKPLTEPSNRMQPANDLSTRASIQNKLLTAPRQQSTQYAELQDRLKQYKIVQQQNDAQAALRFNQQQRAKKAADDAAAGLTPDKTKTLAGARGPAANMPALPGTPRTGMVEPTPPATDQPQIPTNLPPVGSGGGTGVEPTPTPMVRPAPLKIGSLADGVQAKGLADILREAESLIKTGKYSSALEQYDLAEQVAPNNPLIQMGRANVELGRTYYTSAERNLRQAFMADEALLMAQFDLKTLLGQERLDLVVQDLKSIANREQKEPTHVFLLAYIAYNTGNERSAAAYLDLAEKRAVGKDPLYQLIRKHRALPADATAPDLNK